MSVWVFYHLHGLCEDDAVQADQVLVAQRMHGVHLSDEIVQTFRVQHACLQTLHRHWQLERGPGKDDNQQGEKKITNCHLKWYKHVSSRVAIEILKWHSGTQRLNQPSEKVTLASVMWLRTDFSLVKQLVLLSFVGSPRGRFWVPSY